jgi:hypothetical protein
MAWHSHVEYKGEVFHIPMIDFAGRPRLEELQRVGRRLAAAMDVGGDFIFFDTGRSYHGYSAELIPEKAWNGYLGELLLLNQPDVLPVVDTRWVGHALARGFAALRWSHNTDRYLTMPCLVDFARLSPARTPSS